MILMYHNIAEEPGFNTVAVKQFINQLDFIIDNGYRIVSMDNYVEALKNNNFHKHNICITFDDAYRSFEEEVIPILVLMEFRINHYQKLNSAEMRNEIGDSKNQLKEITGSEIKYFSCPFGQHQHFNSTTINSLKKRVMRQQYQQTGIAIIRLTTYIH